MKTTVIAGALVLLATSALAQAPSQAPAPSPVPASPGESAKIFQEYDAATQAGVDMVLKDVTQGTDRLKMMQRIMVAKNAAMNELQAEVAADHKKMADKLKETQDKLTAAQVQIKRLEAQSALKPKQSLPNLKH